MRYYKRVDLHRSNKTYSWMAG